mmetsp:Transcript_57675/g.163781  ORF Transcript_57675/g.163781 Transcript_57675/m.163781 type:complete len:218 (-) Transcript_57675:1723-2376(-)
MASSSRALCSEARSSRTSPCRVSLHLANSSRAHRCCSHAARSCSRSASWPWPPGGVAATCRSLSSFCSLSRSRDTRSTVSAKAFICSAFSARWASNSSDCCAWSSCSRCSSSCASPSRSSASLATRLRSSSFCSTISSMLRSKFSSAPGTLEPCGCAAPARRRFSCRSAASCLERSFACITTTWPERSALHARRAASCFEASSSRTCANRPSFWCVS